MPFLQHNIQLIFSYYLIWNTDSNSQGWHPCTFFIALRLSISVFSDCLIFKLNSARNVPWRSKLFRKVLLCYDNQASLLTHMVLPHLTLSLFFAYISLFFYIYSKVSFLVGKDLYFSATYFFTLHVLYSPAPSSHLQNNKKDSLINVNIIVSCGITGFNSWVIDWLVGTSLRVIESLSHRIVWVRRDP